MVTVEHQVLRGNGGGNQFVAVAHVLGRIFGSDVLEDDLQARQALAQWFHYGVDKACFAVKNINFRVGDFTVHQQRHSQFFHAFKHRHNRIGAGDAVAGVGSGIRRVQFRRGEYAFVKTALQLVRVEGVG